MNNRIEVLRASIRDNNVDGIIVTKQQNWHYLSGFTGSNALLLITSTENLLFTDFRYLEQAANEAPGFKIIKCTALVIDALVEQVNSMGLKRIAFEDDSISYYEYTVYKERLSGIELVPLHQIVEKIRWVKDQAEIEALKKAADITDKAFDYILNKIKPGVKEVEIALELEYFMRKNGAQKPAFDIIAASGFRGALPHGTASEKEIASGEFVVLDFGAVYEGYHADMTRTVVIGKPGSQHQQIYDLVLRAQKKAIDLIRPGVKCSTIDLAARDLITVEGYGANFGHSLGHSVGLEIHERPSFSPKDDTVLEPGMVLTVEPGVYLNGWGGVRIEDLILVTSGGCEILSKSPKELILL